MSSRTPRRYVRTCVRDGFEVPFIPLEQPRALVELYAEKGDRKYERAALKYLRRYLDESEPSLVDVAQLAGVLAERALLMRGL